ncbi:hypothetical protein HPB52_017418 [Rhipicephalus sanguineus]|uniref:Uncharacterized protein n=1 Tax=Rhipicephalus sanguineus TaxID=34632 RepID=A0A9D4T622_RHISA|nr:hypothetical protein HPB52_017418 [Rhipicephalus sanguineus]
MEQVVRRKAIEGEGRWDEKKAGGPAEGEELRRSGIIGFHYADEASGEGSTTSKSSIWDRQTRQRLRETGHRTLVVSFIKDPSITISESAVSYIPNSMYVWVYGEALLKIPALPIIKFMMEMVEILVGMMDNVVYMVGVMVDIVGPLVGVLGKLVVWWTLGGRNGWVVETQSWWVVEQLVGVLGGCRDASCLVGDPVGKVETVRFSTAVTDGRENGQNTATQQHNTPHGDITGIQQ